VSRFRTIVFDFDGTIANTLPLIYRTFNAVLEPRIGRNLPDAEIRSHFGPPDQVILGRYVGAVEQAAAFAEYIERYRRDHQEHVYVYDGIHDLLEAAKADSIRVGVMTGKSRVTAKISFHALGIDNLIDVLVAGDDVTNPKPHPEGVLRALAELGHNPEEPGAMVGDSAADVYAGRGAGLTTIGVTWGVPEHDDLRKAGPDVICESTAELTAALDLTGPA
jgi:HAD superfamily hydrolase (TIGR01509 family)